MLNGPPFALRRYSYTYVPAVPPLAAAVHVTDVPGSEGLAGLAARATVMAGWGAGMVTLANASCSMFQMVSMPSPTLAARAGSTGCGHWSTLWATGTLPLRLRVMV